MGVQERVELAINALREAELDGSRWQVASALLDDACDLAGNHLTIMQGKNLDNARMLYSQLFKRGEPDEELENLYRSEYMEIDERLPRIFQLPHGALKRNSDILTDWEIVHSPTYNEFHVPTGAASALNVRMNGPRGLHIVMLLVSADRTTDWSEGQLKTIQQLLPHIQHFACVRQALTDVGTTVLNNAVGALGAKQIGIVLLNRRGQIVETNDHARRLLSKGTGVQDDKGHLVAHHADDTNALAKLLANALATPAIDSRGGVISVRRPNEPPLAVYASPFFSRTIPNIGNLSEVAVMVMIVDPTDKPKVDSGKLAIALNLTPAQARVAAALASGNNVKSIAASSCRSEAAVRWHLKQMMSHLGIDSQTELVRTILTTPGVFSN